MNVDFSTRFAIDLLARDVMVALSAQAGESHERKN